MKKWTVLLFTVILVLAAGCALADEKGPCGDNLVYEFDSSTFHMDIYRDDSSQDVGAIKKTDWSDAIRKSTKTISIYDGTQIGPEVFAEFPVLYSVGLPDGMEILCFGAFKNCGNLADINLPESLTCIDSLAFNYCENLQIDTLPKSITQIGECTFYRCKSITSLTIPGNVKMIPYACLSFCENLSSLSLPESLEAIDEYGLEACYSLTSLKIPGNVKFVGHMAFNNCVKLQSLAFPAKTAKFDDECFKGCDELSSVTIECKNAVFGSDVFKNTPKLTLRGYRGSTAETYAKDSSIPFESLDWVVSFNAGGGSGSMKDQSVIKGEKYTLPACTFTAPDGKEFDVWDKGAPGEKIDVTADTEITALWKDKPADPAADPGSDPATPADLVNEVTVSGGVYTLDHTALTATFIKPENKNAKKLTIQDTVSANGNEYAVTAVKSKACRKMKKLTTLTVGKNVTKIGSKAFSECGKLKTITIKCPNMKKSGFGSKCFFQIKSGAKFKVPKAAYKNYKKWIVSKGKAPGNSKFKKVK